MMTRDEAIRKVTALLRLAQRGGTVDEAATAAARAQDLMDRFELTQSVVEELDGKPHVEDEPILDFNRVAEGYIDSTKETVYWRWYLAHGIAKLHGCYVWQSRRGKGKATEVIGRPGSVEVVRYTFSWLSLEIEELVSRHGRGMGLVWRREFCEGAVSTIIKRLEQQRADTVSSVRSEYANNPHALMLVSNSLIRMQDATEARALALRTYRLSKGHSRAYTQRDHTAREAGAEAARGINLNQPGRSIGAGQRSIGSGR
jgi:hypothetical protein